MTSPFCKDFDSAKELLHCYIAYCPKTFSYNDLGGQVDDDVDLELVDIVGVHSCPENEVHADEDSTIISRVQHFAQDLLYASAESADHIQMENPVVFDEIDIDIMNRKKAKNNRLMQHCWWYS